MRALTNLSPSVTQGRICIALAAIFWSLSGALTKILTGAASWQVAGPPLSPLLLAFYRPLFASLVLVPLVRRRDLSFPPLLLIMGITFGVMNLLFLRALAEGTAANAVLLQYTAPLWMYLASVWLLGEQADRRSSVALGLGLGGVGILLWGGWREAQGAVVACALGSGVTYAGVVLCLRVLRHASSRWLTAFNHVCGAAILLPFVWYAQPAQPEFGQLVVLFLFGTVQMALPYWLMARGMRTISPQEAGAITLLEPVLNPLWAYLVAPATETPRLYTVAGGVLILGGLAWRYWPGRGRPQGR